MACLPYSVILFILFVSQILGSVFSLNNGVARTPPMGWLAWERFQCNTNCKKDPNNCISEHLFMQMADRLVADGFRDAGYVFVNIDDCWMSRKRDSNGRLVADPERFPQGIKFLSNYMHSRGLKLGIYQGLGEFTCMKYPSIIGHMEQDAMTFAEWEVDMVKLDGCYSKLWNMNEGYVSMENYLNKTGRPMVYSCSWPFYLLSAGMEPNYKLIAEHCNMWRNFVDIHDSWNSIEQVIDFFGDNQEVLSTHAGPGHWNDPDMLVFGNYGMNKNQAKIQFAVWAMLAAPLLMSNDLRELDPKFRDILLNQHVIAVNQDPLGIQGKRIYKKNKIEVWKRPIIPVYDDQYSYALLFMNRKSGVKATTIVFQLKQLGLKHLSGYILTELYDGQNLSAVSIEQSIKIKLKPMHIIMFKAQIIQSSRFA